MGGEPTFVSLDDRDGAEWNTEAVGPSKRKLGSVLLKKLKARYAPKGLLHLGQGKWYPGEQLPRWSLSCYWRKDGEPVWQNPALFADEGVNYGATPAQAALFLKTLADKLGVDPKHVFPAYEDTWYYLWRERRLPSNVDPLRRQARRPARARAPAQGVQAGPRQGGRPRTAAEEEPGALGERRLVPARRALLPHAGRLADGPAPAARLDPLGRGRRPAVPHRAGSNSAIFASAFVQKTTGA